MHESITQPPGHSLSEENNSLSPAQKVGVLDTLSEGVFVVGIVPKDASRRSEYRLHYINPTLCKWLKVDRENISAKPIGDIFPHQFHTPLRDGLEQVRVLKTGLDLEIALAGKTDARQLRVNLSPQKILSAKGEEDCPIVGVVTDVSTLTTRANYLEDRAVRLIDHANLLEISRRDREKEVSLLRHRVKKLERTANFDADTGLPNRAYLLERGAAEFQRSRRYGHALSIAVAEVHGFYKIVQSHGASSGDKAMAGLAQVCESACRAGTDIAGRISQTEIAILLPETTLSGALQFVDRLRSLIADTPIQLENGFIRLGIRSNTDTIQEDDHSFMQCLLRATKPRAEN